MGERLGWVVLPPVRPANNPELLDVEVDVEPALFWREKIDRAEPNLPPIGAARAREEKRAATMMVERMMAA